MRYVMRQKLFSWGDDFIIRDSDGNDLFYVDGKAFTIRETLSFQDRDGNDLALIQQRLLAWGPTYEIHSQGQLRAVVKKAIMTLFECKFSIDVPGPDDLEAKGDFLDHEYTFSRGGQPVATVSKAWLSLTDTYGVEVLDEEDDILILAATVVIDLACHSDGKRT
ncbi:LURP-one-related family protein [Singulisphaera sp. Ch08]|uniref:LURP-one-related family protein n=1 Tax=Singulisphaera sp. Ch08 TaxID=3120278 RepID=A0AAU7CM94_9BACT